MTDALDSSMTLREFLRTSGTLSAEERILVARQALLVLEQNYAHLPLKAARYAVNPLQRLRLLISRLSRATTVEPEWRFHAELLDIFGSLRDLHTRYVLPQPFADAQAFLPFRIKEFVEEDTRRFVIAPQSDGSSGTLPAGAEVTSWNGVPIERAVDVYADRLPGANPAARHARALDTFTVRSLGFAGPPDEEFVLVQYTDLDGNPQETRGPWRVTLPQPPPAPPAPPQPPPAPPGAGPVEQAGSDLEPEPDLEPELDKEPEPDLDLEPEPDAVPELDTELELDLEAARLAWLKTLLFAPSVADRITTGAAEVGGPDEIAVPMAFATSFQARVVPGLSPEIGHIRIRGFTPPRIEVQPGQQRPDIEGFVNVFLDLLGQMPPAGLIVDIRGNPGGVAILAELCLQALTARRIDSEPLQFICSPLNLSICRADDGFADYLPSMEQAVESGAVFSAGVPLTRREWLVLVPQAYIGPVVLLTDARVYSAADRFAAGFQDNGIGPVLGVDLNTGAGGANVWKHADLIAALSNVDDSPYRPLPAGIDITVAIRRTLRVGPNTGTPVEDFGVRSDEVHQTTRDDILQQGVDLMAHAARLLADAGPARRLEVEFDEAAGLLTVRFDTRFVDRADLYIDGRPRESVDLADGAASAILPGKPDPDEVRIEGFAADRLVAVRVFRRDGDGRLRRVTKFLP